MGVLWFPEPPNEPEVDFSTSATGVVAPGAESSDSDEDPPPIGYDGLEAHPDHAQYNLVPDGEGGDGDSEDDARSEASSGSPPVDEFTQFELDSTGGTSNGPASIVVSLLQSSASLWSGPASDIALGEEKEAQVRAAMAGFSLPPSALPPWAAYLPEEHWRLEIRRRIANTNAHS